MMTKKEKKTKKGLLGTILSLVLMILAAEKCAEYGTYLLMDYMYYSDIVIPNENLELFFLIAGVLLLMYLSLYLQLILHEAGHLVFGLLSGYKFASFRIGSFIFIKKDGKMRVKRYSLMGTGGQCLMSPPPMKDGKYPVVLYNLGGCLMNLIVSAVCYALFFMPAGSVFALTVLPALCLDMAIMGVYHAVVNGIPMRVGAINNDGRNALTLGKNPSAAKAIWTHLSVYAYQVKDAGLSDVPDELFYEPTDEELSDPIVAGYATEVFNRYLDEGDYDKAEAWGWHILSVSVGILPVHKLALNGELMFLAILKGADTEIVDGFMTNDMKRYLKASKRSPSAARIGYAYEKSKGNAAGAEKYRAQFEKTARRYPFEGDIRLEHRLLEKV